VLEDGRVIFPLRGRQFAAGEYLLLPVRNDGGNGTAVNLCAEPLAHGRGRMLVDDRYA
jgi:hypothetical protein